MRAGGDADGHTTPESINHAAAQRHQQQLGVLADKDGRLPFDQVAPQNVVGPLLIAGTNATVRLSTANGRYWARNRLRCSGRAR